MVKKILILLFMLALIVYLIFAMSRLSTPPAEARCKTLEVTIEDKQNGFITSGEVESLLKSKGLYPKGERMSDIDTRLLETTLSKHPLIAHAECYKTSDHRIVTEIYQRIPILHVLGEKEGTFYIDMTGATITAPSMNAAYLPVVTGYVNRNTVGNLLKELGVYLKNDPYWNGKIDQIQVTEKQHIELVPRNEDFLIDLGSIHQFKTKLQRLRKFYERGLPAVGKDKYSRINIEYNNQIICTKKEK